MKRLDKSEAMLYIYSIFVVMKDRKKPEVDLRKYGTLMFALGLTLSVSAVLMATEFRYFEERLL